MMNVNPHELTLTPFPIPPNPTNVIMNTNPVLMTPIANTHSSETPHSSNSRRRRNVKIESLPPLETIRVEQLKDFNKDELACWLEHYGVSTENTHSKPDMKKQLRIIIDRLARGEAPQPHPVPRLSNNSSAPTITPFNSNTPQASSFMPYGSNFPNPVDSPTSLNMKGGTSFTFASLPSIAARTPTGNTISFGTPNMPTASMPSNIATQATAISNATHTIHFPKGAITECPSCKRIVSKLGPNFWIHLRIFFFLLDL
eukprot:TRINITY_DN5291_c0_g1_i3.p1 TRINITY_DN5291_c0_g1~~TRINITY_DN5291_c0_g1_i3.p1  ORF type:complete len:257 (-),score=42.89 TRINITY_DN5291_c0_g1_i3:606-1376(-)